MIIPALALFYFCDRPHGQRGLRRRNCRAAARPRPDAAAVGELRKERLYEQRRGREDLRADGVNDGELL